MVTDTISDTLTRIRNANLIKSEIVLIPLTRISKQIVEILEKQGFIESFTITNEKKKHTSLEKTTSSIETNQNSAKQVFSLENKKYGREIQSFNFNNNITVYLKYKGFEKKPCITNLKRISKPSVRIYVNRKKIPKVLGGLGIAILSTSKGIMTDQEARFYGVGGEILCSIW